MEDILSYIIVFGLIIGGVAIWQFRRSKPRPYVLSNQQFPELLLRIVIQKQEGKTKDFVIELKGHQSLSIQTISIEMISKSRELERTDYGMMNEKIKFPLVLGKDQFTRLLFPFASLKTHLQNRPFSFTSFRVVVEDLNHKKFKSHELAFNKNWVIYRPDTGRYN